MVQINGTGECQAALTWAGPLDDPVVLKPFPRKSQGQVSKAVYVLSVCEAVNVPLVCKAVNVSLVCEAVFVPLVCEAVCEAVYLPLVCEAVYVSLTSVMYRSTDIYTAPPVSNCTDYRAHRWGHHHDATHLS